ncbi:hypothetical protein Dimus_018548, partial [Dionaea muscipula]
ARISKVEEIWLCLLGHKAGLIVAGIAADLPRCGRGRSLLRFNEHLSGGGGGPSTAMTTQVLGELSKHSNRRRR